MRRVTLGELLERSVPYERAPIDIDPGLRRGAWVGWLLTSFCLAGYWFLPESSDLLDTAFFIWTRPWALTIWHAITEYRHQLVYACGSAILLTFLVFLATNAFASGEVMLHVGAFVPVVFGALNALVIAMLVLPILVDIIVWAIIISFIVVFALLVLGVIFLSRPR